ncbi:amino acid ABC transporter permease [Humitalea sp. 24SJ18S-53]|uniref:amino acid ABC transporter permease n=1 Tax=Humitalea sp. 24SJ18S-53 TaxID=3422307 RepID=UPI003D66EA10
MRYEWDFGAVFAQAPLLLDGLLGTLRLAGTAIGLGVALGLVLALMRLSPRRLLRWPGTVFVEFYRNTPALVHFFWFYFAMPVVLDISLTAFAAATLALATQSGAFYAEVFRGGIRSLGTGQWEAGRALGMTEAAAMRRIILPQAMARMVAPFVERSFELLKTTSLASTLAYGDLLFRAAQVNSITFRPLETYTVLAGMYVLLLFTFSSGAAMAERRLTAFR